MSNITDLNLARAARETAKREQNTIVSFAAHFSPEARQARARHLLLNWIDEHKEFGAEFLIGELSGALVTVQAMEE